MKKTSGTVGEDIGGEGYSGTLAADGGRGSGPSEMCPLKRKRLKVGRQY